MAKLPKNMDAPELIAHDLEARQKLRFKNAAPKLKEHFYERENEAQILIHIDLFRSYSKTYNTEHRTCLYMGCTNIVRIADGDICKSHFPSSD